MTFLKLTRSDDKEIRVNMDHVSEYYKSTFGDWAILVYEGGEELQVKETSEYIDTKLREIELWRKNAHI